MLQIYQRLTASAIEPKDSITLDFDTRQKARIKTTTDAGLEVGIFLERGHPLRVGEVLQSECGQHFLVKGADEPVITASTDDWLAFSKICYHLGNRHTRVQVGKKWLRLKPDHVLQELVESFGLHCDHTPAVFDPESGAYGKHSGHHHHD